MFLLVCIILLIFPDKAAVGAREGMRVAFETVMPSILPFAVFSSAIVYSGAAEKAARLCAPFFVRVLKLNPYGAVAYISGLLGGYPAGCRVVCDLYKKQLIDKARAEKILTYSNNGGIIFAVSVCGKAAFASWEKGVIIFVMSAISALIVGCATGKDKGGELVLETKKQPLMAVFGKSIVSGGNVAINILSAFVVFYAIGNALGLEKVPFVYGLAELTKGVFYAGEINNLPLGAFFFSFGGICVLAQSATFCAEGEISLKKHITAKIISSALTYILTYVAVNSSKLGLEGIVFTVLVVISIVCALKLLQKQTHRY